MNQRASFGLIGISIIAAVFVAHRFEANHRPASRLISSSSSSLPLPLQELSGSGYGTASILSDIRFKDIHGFYKRGLDDVLKVDTILFNYKKDNPMGADPTQELVGVAAQNLQKVIPEAVNKEKSGYLTVNVSPVIWALVNAVKDLNLRFTEQLASQSKDIAALQTEYAGKVDRVEVMQLKLESSNKDKEIKRLSDENTEIRARLERIEKTINAN